MLLATLSHAEILPATFSGRHTTLDEKALFAVEVIDSNIRNTADDVCPRGLQGALKIAGAILRQAIAGQADEAVSFDGKTLNALVEKMEHVCKEFPIFNRDKKVIKTLAEYNKAFGRASGIAEKKGIDPRSIIFRLETGEKPILATPSSQAKTDVTADEIIETSWVSPDLVEKGGDLLCDAARLGELEEAKRLLRTGIVNVNFMDEEGRSPLFWALLCGHFDVADLLFEKGANPSCINPKNGSSILHVAALDNNKPVVEWLLDHGVDINIPKRGSAIMTALDLVEMHLSFSKGDKEFVVWLLSKGARRA